MPRELFRECVKILKNTEPYRNAKGRVVYRMEKIDKVEQKGY